MVFMHCMISWANAYGGYSTLSTPINSSHWAFCIGTQTMTLIFVQLLVKKDVHIRTNQQLATTG